MTKTSEKPTDAKDKSSVSVEDIEVITGVLEDARIIFSTIEKCSGMLEVVTTLQERLWNSFVAFNWIVSPIILALIVLHVLGGPYNDDKLSLLVMVLCRSVVIVLFSMSIISVPDYYMAIIAVCTVYDECFETYDTLVRYDDPEDESGEHIEIYSLVQDEDLETSEGILNDEILYTHTNEMSEDQTACEDILNYKFSE